MGAGHGCVQDAPLGITFILVDGIINNAYIYDL